MCARRHAETDHRSAAEGNRKGGGRARRQSETRFPRLRCDRRHARAFRSAYQDGSAEVGKSDRGGQDRKSEIKRLHGEDLMKVAARLVAIAAAVLAAGAVQAASY